MKRDNRLTILVLSLMALVMVGTVLVIALSLQTNPIEQGIQNSETIAILLSFEDQRQLETAVVLFHDLATGSMGMVTLPVDLGAILPSLNRSDSYAQVLIERGREAYLQEITRLLGVPIDYYLAIESDWLPVIVDLAHGLDWSMAEAFIDAEIGVRIPGGQSQLYGAKARQLLTVASLNSEEQRTNEIDGTRLVKSLVESLRQLSLGDSWDHLEEDIFRGIDSNLESQHWKLWLQSIDAERLAASQEPRITGVVRTIQTDRGETRVLFPHYDGRLLRESIAQLNTVLGSEDQTQLGLEDVSLRILNGTDVNGLARKTMDLYVNYGFNVIEIGNALENVEKTVIVDHRGNPSGSRRVADVIQANNVELDMRTEEEIESDFTLILGSDFDGLYVR